MSDSDEICLEISNNFRLLSSYGKETSLKRRNLNQNNSNNRKYRCIKVTRTDLELNKLGKRDISTSTQNLLNDTWSISSLEDALESLSCQEVATQTHPVINDSLHEKYQNKLDKRTTLEPIKVNQKHLKIVPNEFFEHILSYGPRNVSSSSSESSLSYTFDSLTSSQKEFIKLKLEKNVDETLGYQLIQLLRKNLKPKAKKSKSDLSLSQLKSSTYILPCQLSHSDSPITTYIVKKTREKFKIHASKSLTNLI